MKKIWSKAISGYANSCDGIIVWGIDARKDEYTSIVKGGVKVRRAISL